MESTRRTIQIENLFGKTLAIDAFNVIYQFLNAVRGTDGKSLTNIRGDVTSHLTGLLYRNIRLFEHNIKPIYCFDGSDKLTKLRWSDGKILNRVRINNKIISSSKELLDYLGISYIQAPGEGEAQCVYLNKNGDTWGIVSQDYDVLIYGGERLVRNLTSSKTRKKGNITINTEIEYFLLSKVLTTNQISHSQLIDMCILIGNDYFSGVKGIGDKTALRMIKKYGSIEKMPLANNNGYIITKHKHNEELSKTDFYIIVEEMRDIYLNPKIESDYIIKRKKPNLDKLRELLFERYNFSKDRVDNSIKKLNNLLFSKKQNPLDIYL